MIQPILYNKVKYCAKILLVVLVGLSSSSLFAQYTRVSGVVKDSISGEPLPFVNITFKNKNIGTITDLNGYYDLNTQWASEILMVSFVGYNPKEIRIKLGEKQTLNVLLSPGVAQLKEVEIKADKARYKNRGNPAVELIKNVIDHKSENRLASDRFDFFEYERYEKDQYDINNFSRDWLDKKTFKSFRVLSDYVDTSTVNGKPFIPILIKEKISRVYVRQQPKTTREVVEANRLSGFENSIFGDGVGQFLEKLTGRVDIYDNTINLLDKPFTSPISFVGPNVYRYYITDSTEINGQKFTELSFMPRDPGLIAFTGKMLVGDSTLNYVVKEIELNIDRRININFLEDLRVIQKFEYLDSIGWIITEDQITVDVQPSGKGMGLFNTKTVHYSDFKVNIQREDELYGGLNRQIVDEDPFAKSDSFWAERRHLELSQQEKGIYKMADTILNIPEFKTIATIGEFVLFGYLKSGPFDVGPITSLVSYNDVEGIRMRFGGRTNLKFHEKWRFGGYGAFGFGDEKWKYSGFIEYHFSKNPVSVFHFSYKEDIHQPGFGLDWQDQDNVFLSFRRAPADNIYYKREMLSYFKHEWIKGFMNTFQILQREILPSARNSLELNNTAGLTVPALRTTELTFGTRIALNEKYVQGRFTRASIKTTAPIFSFDYSYSSPILGSDFEYHKLYLSYQKRFKFGILGFTDTEIEGTKIFNKVPFLLMDVHRGNETFTYDDRSYNLMNFLEFASDQSIAFMATHHFNGFVTSRIPLMDRLKLRLVSSGKVLYGTISDENANALDSNLFVFPTRMGALSAKPYAEVSVGLENIVKLFRIDLVKRLTYLDRPGVASMWGVKGLAVRFKIQISF